MRKSPNQRAAEGLRGQGWMTNRDVYREFPWVTRDQLKRMRAAAAPLVQFFIPFAGSKTIYYRREEIEGLYKMPGRIIPEAELRAGKLG